MHWRPLLWGAYVKLVWERSPWVRQKGADQFEVGCDWANPFQSPVCLNYCKHKPPTLCWSLWIKVVLLAGSQNVTVCWYAGCYSTCITWLLSIEYNKHDTTRDMLHWAGACICGAVSNSQVVRILLGDSRYK